MRRAAAGEPVGPAGGELPWEPARVIMQGVTGVPAVVDLAGMRSAMDRLGGDPRKVNPLCTVDLVIDHSAQVDCWAADDAVDIVWRSGAGGSSGPKGKGEWEMFDIDGRIIDKLPRQLMLGMIREGKMPAGKQPQLLSEEEIRQIETWATPPRDLRY